MVGARAARQGAGQSLRLHDPHKMLFVLTVSIQLS